MFDEAIPTGEVFYNIVSYNTCNDEEIFEEKKLITKDRKQIKKSNFAIQK